MATGNGETTETTRPRQPNQRRQRVSEWTGLLAFALLLVAYIVIGTLEYANPGWLSTRLIKQNNFWLGRQMQTWLTATAGMSVCLAGISLLAKPTLRAKVTLLLSSIALYLAAYFLYEV